MKNIEFVLSVVLGIVSLILPPITSNIFLTTSIFEVEGLSALSGLPSFLPYLLIGINILILVVLFILFLKGLKKGDKLLWIISIVFFVIGLINFSLTFYLLYTFIVIQQETLAIVGIV